MKHISASFIALACIAMIAVSCNTSGKPDHQHPADTTTETAKATGGDTVMVTTPATVGRFSIAPLVNDYLVLKNALVADNDRAAAEAGQQMLATLAAADSKAVPADKLQAYRDIVADVKENAEHIRDNTGKIFHQREHLASLSKDLDDLIKVFGTPQQLYQDRCPMFNDGKGAIWLSEKKEISNPYYGSKMPGCGAVKKEY